MSSPASEPRGSRDPSSSDQLSVEVHLLECGHGDTILVQLPGHRWALIDCHLPTGRIRNRFYDFVRTRGINRFDLLCLTHAHRDHFLGMIDVVDHFTRDGRSIGWFCDAGVDPAQVRDLLRAARRPDLEVSEYEALHRRLGGLIDSEAIRYVRLDENTYPITVGGCACDVRLTPIGPEPGLIRGMTRRAIGTGEIEQSLNAISLILLLHVASEGESFEMLLAGDADRTGLERALRIYSARHTKEDPLGYLDAVKVPHHGSTKSHTPALVTAGSRRAERVAAVSVGTRFRALPDREVMSAYIEHGWTVLVTTKRTRVPRRHSLLEIAARRVSEDNGLQRQNISIAWNPNQGLTWSPRTAQITADDLKLYGTAATVDTPSATPRR